VRDAAERDRSIRVDPIEDPANASSLLGSVHGGSIAAGAISRSEDKRALRDYFLAGRVCAVVGASIIAQPVVIEGIVEEAADAGV
jgi:hypothetical protein